MDNNINFDETTLSKLKDMINKGQLNDVISQIPPEMIQNFSSMMKSQQSNNNSNNSENNEKTTSKKSNFDFNNIDMNTILKLKTIMEQMNSSNDPRSNLLYSLKPYLREERKGKVDQYANLLNFAKLAELLKNDNNKENNLNG